MDKLEELFMRKIYWALGVPFTGLAYLLIFYFTFPPREPWQSIYDTVTILVLLLTFGSICFLSPYVFTREIWEILLKKKH